MQVCTSKDERRPRPWLKEGGRGIEAQGFAVLETVTGDAPETAEGAEVEEALAVREWTPFHQTSGIKIQEYY
jgi:hypothetical protein